MDTTLGVGDGTRNDARARVAGRGLLDGVVTPRLGYLFGACIESQVDDLTGDLDRDGVAKVFPLIRGVGGSGISSSVDVRDCGLCASFAAAAATAAAA